MRLDQYIKEKFGYTRNRAQFFITEKLVKVNSVITTKNSLDIKEEDIVEITEDKRKEFVSRSAVKLDDFLSTLDPSIDVTGKLCIDVWASTGWFTQVLLERWASKVFAVDVGTFQLSDKLRADDRVISLENTDIRLLSIEESKLKTAIQCLQLEKEYFEVITVDVSFLSLSKIIDNLIGLSGIGTHMILLFKPQFEVGKANMKKTWLPKNEWVVLVALDKFKRLCKEKWLKIKKISESTLPGEAWNKEYLIYIML